MGLPYALTAPPRPALPPCLTLVDVHCGQGGQEVVAHQHAEEHKVVHDTLQVVSKGQAARQRRLELGVKVVAQQAVLDVCVCCLGFGVGERRSGRWGGSPVSWARKEPGQCSVATAAPPPPAPPLRCTHPICSSTKCSWQGLSSTSRAGWPRPPPVNDTTSRSRQKSGSCVTRLRGGGASEGGEGTERGAGGCTSGCRPPPGAESCPCRPHPHPTPSRRTHPTPPQHDQVCVQAVQAVTHVGRVVGAPLLRVVTGQDRGLRGVRGRGRRCASARHSGRHPRCPPVLYRSTTRYLPADVLHDLVLPLARHIMACVWMQRQRRTGWAVRLSRPWPLAPHSPQSTCTAKPVSAPLKMMTGFCHATSSAIFRRMKKRMCAPSRAMNAARAGGQEQVRRQIDVGCRPGGGTQARAVQQQQHHHQQGEQQPPPPAHVCRA